MQVDQPNEGQLERGQLMPKILKQNPIYGQYNKCKCNVGSLSPIYIWLCDILMKAIINHTCKIWGIS